MKPPRAYDLAGFSVCAECVKSYHYCMSCDVRSKEKGAKIAGFCSVYCAVKWSRRKR